MSSYPQSHWMPHLNASQTLQDYPTEDDWKQVFGLAAETLADCCSEAPSEDCFSD